MHESVFAEDQFYIKSATPPADDRTLVLKHGETFAVFDHYGDILPIGMGEQGIFHKGTRFLSWLELSLEGSRPLLLYSTVQKDNDLLTVDMMNPDLTGENGEEIPRGGFHIYRSKLLWEGVCYERLRFTNFHQKPIQTMVQLRFSSDFADIFEVRGVARERRGTFHEPVMTEDGAIFSYDGLDGTRRSCRIVSDPAPRMVGRKRFAYDIQLEPKETVEYTIHTELLIGEPERRAYSYETAIEKSGNEFKRYRRRVARVQTSNAQFNGWLSRSYADMMMMISETAYGPYPFAGVPWFSTVFGRDGIITALQNLWIDPTLARGVLRYLAAKQSTEDDPAIDAEPGKILHEERPGEMAMTGEVPFRHYYGSVDSTPLFIMLAAAYYDRTGDYHLIESIWPNIEAAIHWMDEYGDADRDGFIEFNMRSPNGLVYQGWKDSHDSIFHADGTLAQGPIALCEVQAYAYAAYLGAARMAEDFGKAQTIGELRLKAEVIRDRFEKMFWSDNLSMYGLALDGEKRLCQVKTSNAGHCLFGGIAQPDRAKMTAERLLTPELFSGWGIRTLSSDEHRFNPMSYHNGSVWPHDNSLIAWGMGEYGLADAVDVVMEAMFDTAMDVDLYRLPELICGFHRRAEHGPTFYPVACRPQAWATGSVFMLLQSCLRLKIGNLGRRISFNFPRLPPFINELEIRDLTVGSAVVDIILYRYEQDVGINVQRKQGDVEVVVVK